MLFAFIILFGIVYEMRRRIRFTDINVQVLRKSGGAALSWYW